MDFWGLQHQRLNLLQLDSEGLSAEWSAFSPFEACNFVRNMYTPF